MVIAILAIIAAGASLEMTGSKRAADLDSSANTIESMLRGAQSKALGGRDSKNWGVSFDSLNNKLVLFSEDGISKTTIEENYLSSLVKINESSMQGGCNEIIFTKPRGETIRDCTIRIEDSQNPGLFSDISIRTTGFVGINP